MAVVDRVVQLAEMVNDEAMPLKLVFSANPAAADRLISSPLQEMVLSSIEEPTDDEPAPLDSMSDEEPNGSITFRFPAASATNFRCGEDARNAPRGGLDTAELKKP